MYAAKHGYVEAVEALVEHRDPSARVSIYIYTLQGVEQICNA